MMPLYFPNAPHGNDANTTASQCMDSQPQLFFENGDEREPFFACTMRGNSQTELIMPQRLRIDEINAVLVFIGSALYRIKFEFHGNII